MESRKTVLFQKVKYMVLTLAFIFALALHLWAEMRPAVSIFYFICFICEKICFIC